MPARIYDLPLRVRKIIRELREYSSDGTISEDCLGRFYKAGPSWGRMFIGVDTDKVKELKKYDCLILTREYNDKETRILKADTSSDSIVREYRLDITE